MTNIIVNICIPRFHFRCGNSLTYQALAPDSRTRWNQGIIDPSVASFTRPACFPAAQPVTWENLLPSLCQGRPGCVPASTFYHGLYNSDGCNGLQASPASFTRCATRFPGGCREPGVMGPIQHIRRGLLLMRARLFGKLFVHGALLCDDKQLHVTGDVAVCPVLISTWM